MKQKQTRAKMHVKLGDKVKVITGKDKGKTGTILKTFRDKGKVIVQDINMKIKHTRPDQEGGTGQIIKKEAPIDSSNVMLYNPITKIASRSRKIYNKKGKKEQELIKLKDK
jgi:large subunit ribosomal protein L24